MDVFSQTSIERLLSTKMLQSAELKLIEIELKKKLIRLLTPNIIPHLFNTKEKKQLFSNFSFLLTLQAANYLLPLLTIPYLIHILGIENYGLIVFAQSLMTFFIIFIDFGFQLSATKNISLQRDNKDYITELYNSVLSIKVILLFICFLSLSLMILGIEKFHNHATLYFLSFISVVGQGLFPVWFFQGMEKMKYITIISISMKVVSCLCIFLFINSKKDLLLVPIFNGVPLIFGSIISIILISQLFAQSIKFQNPKKIWSHFYESVPFFVSRISVLIYTSANIFILGLFTNNITVGYYSVAEKLYLAIQGLYNPMIQALYPFMAKHKNIALFKKIFTLILILNIILIATLFMSSGFLFNLLLTNYNNVISITVFKIFLISCLIVVPSILLGHPFLGALGFSKDVNYSVIFGSLIHLCGLTVLILTGEINAYNLTFMIVITELSVFLYRIYLVKERKYA